MLRKYKYGIPIVIGAAAVALVLALTLPKIIVKDETAAETVSEKTETVSSVNESTDPSEPVSSSEAETETEAESTEEETVEPSGEETWPEDEFIPIDPKEESGVVGLRRYFRGKLIINTEKVHLYLNVRREPNDDSEILAVLWPADIVRYDGRQGDWYRVVMDGYFGYVHTEYVLTDDDAFRQRIHSVGYAAVVKDKNTPLYSDRNDFTSEVKQVGKGKTFRIIGVTTECYKLEVDFDGFKMLYCKQKDVIPYYLFLAPGNESGMSEWEEESMATMEISNNLERVELVRAEAEAERAAYESQLAEYIAQSKAAEASKLAEAYRRSSEEAARQATAWMQNVSTASPNQQADSSGRRYIGTFRVTHYCHCQKCCGVWGNNDPNYNAHGASGLQLIDNYSVSVNKAQIPFGTKLYVVRKDAAGNVISEKEYIAADEGVPAYAIDIYRKTHEAALAGGMYYAEVYIIP